MEDDGLLSALVGLEREALKLAAALVTVVLLAVAFTASTFMTFFAAARPGQPISSAEVHTIPTDQLVSMQAAAGQCALSWQVLAGIAKVESDFGRNMATSSAGAIGYGQFLPSTWASYGGGGNPYDYRDALPAMARYLCAAGADHDLRSAIFAYNHADWYVDEVLADAVRFGYLPPGSGSSMVVDIARAQTGRPYVWGGASVATSFDCSGLVQWAYAQVGIALPRTAQQQFDATARVPLEQLQPGDVVFFADTYPSSDRITHVGIYVGEGRMINAPSEGDVIHEMQVFDGYWGEHFAGGGRVAGIA